MKAGITGHQNISRYDILWIKKTLSDIIKMEKITFGYSSLAIGVDQLFVRRLLELSIPYEIIIPCNEYEETFTTESDKTNYLELLKKAEKKIILDYHEPSEKAFNAAGQKVVELADILIAVWDGKEAKGLGGTADIVKYAISLKKQISHINPITKTQKMIRDND